MKKLLYLLTFISSFAFAQTTVRMSATATGTNTYSALFNPNVAAFNSSTIYVIPFTNANSSGTITLDPDSGGPGAAVSIKGDDGNDLAVGAIKAGGTYQFKFNGTLLRMIGSAGGGWVDTGVQTLTGPFGVESTDSIGIAANGTSIRSGRDVTSSFITGTPGGGNEYGQVGVYRDATFGSYAFMATSNAGASVIARMDVQSWPGGQSSADIDADTIHISKNEVNVLKIVPSGAWQLGASLAPGTATHVLTSNGAGAAPTWQAGGGNTNTSSALTDGSTITITGVKHTLTSTQATITWTLSQTQDFQTTDIILNATSSTYTFPANALCVTEGVESGNNTAALAGVSGDHYIMSIYKDGTNYRVAIKNFGQ